MFSTNQKEQAIERFSTNSYWKERYENAPSDKCREWIVFEHCNTQFGSEHNFDSIDDFIAERDRLECQLDLADWKHLLKYSGNNPWRGICKKNQGVGGSTNYAKKTILQNEAVFHNINLILCVLADSEHRI